MHRKFLKLSMAKTVHVKPSASRSHSCYIFHTHERDVQETVENVGVFFSESEFWSSPSVVQQTNHIHITTLVRLSKKIVFKWS